MPFRLPPPLWGRVGERGTKAVENEDVRAARIPLSRPLRGHPPPQGGRVEMASLPFRLPPPLWGRVGERGTKAVENEDVRAARVPLSRPLRGHPPPRGGRVDSLPPPGWGRVEQAPARTRDGAGSHQRARG